MKFSILITVKFFLLASISLKTTISNDIFAQTNHWNLMLALTHTCDNLLEKFSLEEIKCGQKSNEGINNGIKFICLNCQEQLEHLQQEKTNQQLNMIEEQRNQIYRNHLANRVKSSILRDFLAMRY